jgi:cell volume regulation protein A
VVGLSEVHAFGGTVLVVSLCILAALLSTKLTLRFPVPGPALFLLGAAIASDVFPGLQRHTSILLVERIGVAALIVILFDGGMHIGRRRFRGSWVPITVLGTAGTFATAGLIAVFAHSVLGFSWIVSGILGAAVAPTDPAVMFSVLGNHEVAGRTGTILEGESGANDPVGIALMLGMLEYATASDGSFWTVVREFCVQMSVGLAVGAVGAYALRLLLRRVRLPREGLYPLASLSGAAAIYGVAAVAHGSGFIAVFAAGLLLGDERLPFKSGIERFQSSLASLAEIVVFVALGLTIHLGDLTRQSRLWDGLALAVLLTFVVRPVVIGPMLVPARLRNRERLFVVWGGLKGAVPILLTTLVVLSGVSESARIYDIVFVVVLFSVVVQGTSMPFAARALHVPMRLIEPTPWSISIPLRTEARVQRYVVAPGSRAAGEAIRDLPLGEHTWVSLVLRRGEPVEARGSHRFAPGDEVLLLGDSGDATGLRHLFEGAG